MKEKINEYLKKNVVYKDNVITSHCPMYPLKKEVCDEFGEGAERILAEWLIENVGEEIIMRADGDVFCYSNGLLHRDGDKPAIIINGTYGSSLSWFQYGVLHRDEDKPAVVESGYEEFFQWYQNGLLHREDKKPALIINCAECGEVEHHEWYEHGVFIGKKKIDTSVDKDIEESKS
jgi:hypothetical protein